MRRCLPCPEREAAQRLRIAAGQAEAAAAGSIDSSKSFKSAIEKLRDTLENEKQEALALQAAKLCNAAAAEKEHAMTELRSQLQAAASREKQELITELQAFGLSLIHI